MHGRCIPSESQGLSYVVGCDDLPRTNAKPLLGECLFIAPRQRQQHHPWTLPTTHLAHLAPSPRTILRSRRDVDKRPVDALVSGTCVSETCARVKTDGIVLGGSHVHEINALFWEVSVT